jgi:hypothetical protein
LLVSVSGSQLLKDKKFYESYQNRHLHGGISVEPFIFRTLFLLKNRMARGKSLLEAVFLVNTARFSFVIGTNIFIERSGQGLTAILF